MLVHHGMNVLQLSDKVKLYEEKQFNFLEDFVAIEEKLEKLYLKEFERHCGNPDAEITIFEDVSFSQDEICYSLWNCYQYVTALENMLLPDEIVEELRKLVGKP